MFHVYGREPEKVKQSWMKHNPQKKDEKDAEYASRLKMVMDNAAPKLIKEFDLEDNTNQFIKLCEQSGEYDRMCIKIRKLYSTSNKKRPVSSTMVDVNELQNIDAAEQNQLRELLDGGRFA